MNFHQDSVSEGSDPVRQNMRRLLEDFAAKLPEAERKAIFATTSSATPGPGGLPSRPSRENSKHQDREHGGSVSKTDIEAEVTGCADRAVEKIISRPFVFGTKAPTTLETNPRSELPGFSFGAPTPSSSQVFWKPRDNQMQMSQINLAQSQLPAQRHLSASGSTADDSADSRNVTTTSTASTTEKKPVLSTPNPTGLHGRHKYNDSIFNVDNIGEADYIEPYRMASPKVPHPTSDCWGAPFVLSSSKNSDNRPRLQLSLLNTPFEPRLGSDRISFEHCHSSFGASTANATPANSTLGLNQLQANAPGNSLPSRHDGYEVLVSNPDQQKATNGHLPSNASSPDWSATQEPVLKNWWNLDEKVSSTRYNGLKPDKRRCGLGHVRKSRASSRDYVSDTADSTSSMDTVKEFLSYRKSLHLPSAEDRFATLNRSGPVHRHIPDMHKQLTDVEILKVIELCIEEERQRAEPDGSPLVSLITYPTLCLVCLCAVDTHQLPTIDRIVLMLFIAIGHVFIAYLVADPGI